MPKQLYSVRIKVTLDGEELKRTAFTVLASNETHARQRAIRHLKKQWTPPTGALVETKTVRAGVTPAR